MGLVGWLSFRGSSESSWEKCGVEGLGGETETSNRCNETDYLFVCLIVSRVFRIYLEVSVAFTFDHDRRLD